MIGVFVSGADTDAGKTVVSAGLLRALRQLGQPWQSVKPVQTGIDPRQPTNGADAQVHAEAVADILGPAALTLHSFQLAASPHLAAARENARLNVPDLVKELAALPGPLLVEGAGGALVPFNNRETMLDLMRVLGLPVVVVVPNRLGAINHTLLTVQAVLNAGLKLAGVVAVQTSPLPAEAEKCLILQDNIEWLRQHPDVPALWTLDYEPALAQPLLEQRRAAWQRIADRLQPLAQCLVALAAPGGEKAVATAGSASSEKLVALDERILWHPYTSSVQPLPVYVADHAQGAHIYLRDGRKLIDGMASWWCAVHGYGHPALVGAAQRQAGRMSHVMFGGLTHEPAVQLAQELLKHSPAGLARVFFADSGSVAVEVALKMALQYHRALGDTARSRILAPRGGYHGDTLGAMSVCDPVTGMHQLFQGLLTEQSFVPRPSCRFDQPFDPASVVELEKAFAEHGPRLAALILEPIVQGAGGMWFYHPEYLSRARALCDAHGVLMIVDEIATGFGRTGKYFASEWAGISPDILCCGKALTGGMLSLAATVCTEKVASGVSAHGNVLMHGPTFMGNPLACQVALASLALLDREDWHTRVSAVEAALKKGLSGCAGLPGVADVRVLGAIGVVECEKPVPMAALQRFFVEQGVWIRPFNRLIYLMPPYTSTGDDLHTLTAAVEAAVRSGRISAE